MAGDRVTRIAICGGTGLAHALAAVLGADPANEVRVLTRQPERWSGAVQAIYLDKAEVTGAVARVSDRPEDVVAGAGIVFVCVPLPFRADLLRSIAPFLDPSAWVGGVPGFAGFDWEARRILGSSARLFGLQRVPYVRKTISYGETVWISGIRPRLYLAALPASEAPALAARIERLLSIPTEPLPNYFPVTLSASNPIFHPARLFGAFAAPGAEPVPQQFYEDWDDCSSAAYLGLDADLQAIAAALPLDTAAAVPITRHFDARSPAELSRRIRSIRALRDRPLPLRSAPDGYAADLQSHYFTEDACFSLIVLRAVADIVGVTTPWMDRVILWTQQVTGKEYIQNGQIIGRDAALLPTPFNCGVYSPTSLAKAAIT